MSELTPEDEALIQRFIGLNTADQADLAVKLPPSAATSTDWSLALLVRIVTDRTVLDNPFSEAMSKAWNSHHHTVFCPVSRNCYLVEFMDQVDFETALLSGPWTFRGDLVAARQVTSHSDLRIENIEYGQIWVQFFNVPVNSLTEEGVRIVSQDIGQPISLSAHGFVSGRRFIKQKLLVKLDRALRDTLTWDHPSLGPVTVHCHYEKVARICVFCGRMGHEMTGCNDHARLTMLLQRSEQRGKYNMDQVLAPKYGNWMTNVGCIPREGTYAVRATNKRSYCASNPSSEGGSDSFFGDQMASELPNPSSYSLQVHGDGVQVKRSRGSGDSTISTLNRYLRSTRAVLAFISETRCSEEIAIPRIQNLSLSNSVVVPSRGRSGGLWLIWGDEVQVRVIKATRFYIMAEVKLNDGGEAWGLAGIYGDPSRVLNQAIWDDITEFVNQMEGKACLLGDFNAITACNEKRGGSSALGPNNAAFRSWIHMNGLIDLGHHGPCYTWSNKQYDHNPIDQKLDRGLGTASWSLQYPNSAIFHLPRFGSDHLPILLRTNAASVRGKPQFRVESWWALKPGFKDVCRKAVEQGKAEWSKTRSCLKKEVKSWLGDHQTPAVMLKAVEDKMEALNAQPPDQHTSWKEKCLNSEHKQILSMEEKHWHQRSRIEWALFGDDNTRFYHATAVTRKRRNTITAIQLENGAWESDPRRITALFVNHFRGIYTKVNLWPISEIYPIEILQGIDGVPQAVHHHLEAFPTEPEVYKALMSLGPNKAVGPDGFTASILQENWDIFKVPVMGQVSAFFEIGLMPSSISRSSLVLIPKTESAARVGDFRPISVCNTLYKVIPKLLTLRLKPYISGCISKAQSAFLPGHEISENVILLREVLHSFSLPDYKNKEFCLKVDLSKAFDRMDWSFLESIMPLYNFPPRFASWILSCIKSAEFMVIINGKGDGFFRPQCGLRQGCSLSPYMFILGMDILSRHLSYLASKRLIRGVRIAPSAGPLTDCLYADDLLIFGAATVGESTIITQALQVFSSVSGQLVGPQKSNLWFSLCTSQHEQEEISQILSVPLNRDCSSYLGAPIATNTESFDFLIAKFSSKLQLWKSNMLSQAGRIVLIKSVLQALPIYYMATAKIPKTVIKRITSIIRSFFWGKAEHTRYMAYIGWHKIMRPKGMGGLGLTDMSVVNDALLMKFLWRLASGSGALWVQIVRAKYLPRSQLWLSKRLSRCTPFWRALMQLRESMLPALTWRLGDGENCSALGQPWFENALYSPIQQNTPSNLKVKDLTNSETGAWDVDRLIHLFGYVNTMHIIQDIQPPRPAAGLDRLVFKESTSGVLSVKKASILLSRDSQQPVLGDKQLWQAIWHKGRVLPRIPVFMWKLVHDGLPLASTLHRRFPTENPICALCGSMDEDVSHLTHRCSLARACHFVGPIALRSDLLPASFHTAVQSLSTQLDDSQWTEYANSLWAIWRCRNDRIYGGKEVGIEQFWKYYNTVARESAIRQCGSSSIKNATDIQHEVITDDFEFSCFVDGSWSQGWEGGIRVCLMQGKELKEYRSVRARGCCAVQIEAMAMKLAVEMVRDKGIVSCIFLSDCKSLVEWVNALAPPIDSDWRASLEILAIWNIMRQSHAWACKHIPREQNAIADCLAKLGRMHSWDTIGYTYPLFLAT